MMQNHHLTTKKFLSINIFKFSTTIEKIVFTFPKRLCVIMYSNCCSLDPTIGTSARMAHLPRVVVSPLLIESVKTSTRRLLDGKEHRIKINQMWNSLLNQCSFD
jgi:hypothetical protein